MERTPHFQDLPVLLIFKACKTRTMSPDPFLAFELRHGFMLLCVILRYSMALCVPVHEYPFQFHTRLHGSDQPRALWVRSQFGLLIRESQQCPRDLTWDTVNTRQSARYTITARFHQGLLYLARVNWSSARLPFSSASVISRLKLPLHSKVAGSSLTELERSSSCTAVSSSSWTASAWKKKKREGSPHHVRIYLGKSIPLKEKIKVTNPESDRNWGHLFSSYNTVSFYNWTRAFSGVLLILYLLFILVRNSLQGGSQ